MTVIPTEAEESLAVKVVILSAAKDLGFAGLEILRFAQDDRLRSG